MDIGFSLNPCPRKPGALYDDDGGARISDLADRLSKIGDNIYLALEHLAARRILRSVDYQLSGRDRSDLFKFDHLSEGEKQLIAVVGALRLIILDPCRKADCDLLAFQADGRPILNPAYKGDPIARRRVNESKIVLNLDHPDFNAKREQLYHAIADDVKAFEELPRGSGLRATIHDRITERWANRQ